MTATDIYCRVCSETWDTHYLRTESPPWVRDLVIKGAGCESCEGIAPANVTTREQALAIEEKGLRSIVGADFDSGEEIEALYAKRPKWKRPEDKLVWACSDCDACLYIDLDWREGDGSYVYGRKLPQSRSYGYGETWERVSEALYDVTGAESGASRCESCAREHTCGDCGAECPDGNFTDPRNPYRGQGLCEDCYSNAQYENAENGWDSHSVRELCRALEIRTDGPAFEFLTGLSFKECLDMFPQIEVTDEGAHVRKSHIDFRTVVAIAMKEARRRGCR